MYKNLKIRHKISIGPLSSALSFLLIILVTLLLGRHNNDLLEKIETGYYPSLKLNQNLETTLSAIQLSLQDAVALEDSDVVVETDKHRDGFLWSLEASKGNPVIEIQKLNDLRTIFEDYYVLARRTTIAMITKGEMNEGLVTALDSMTTNFNKVQRELVHRTGFDKQRIAKAFAASQDNHEILLGTIILATVISLLLLVWLSIVVTKSIIRPLNKTVRYANEVAKGNFDAPIKFHATDEMGVLANAFLKMTKEIGASLEEKQEALQHAVAAEEDQRRIASKLAKTNTQLASEISERKLAEQKLREAHDELELRVQERTLELTNANKELKIEIAERKRAKKRQGQLLEELANVNRELKDFAYIVSHDLKAPLRAIGSLSDWLKSDYEEQLDEGGKELVELLSTRVRRMNDLIDGVLQYSRVGRVSEEKVKVDLNQVVHNVIDSIVPPENIALEVQDELPTVWFDKTRITQVFQNLISNAVKYMDKPKGEIKIGCAAENGSWEFSVSDNGPGIAEEHFDKIFQIFQTLQARDVFESTGVGLSVVKKIIKMYGGKIWVESMLGSGATFFFTIPKERTTLHERDNGERNEKQKADPSC